MSSAALPTLIRIRHTIPAESATGRFFRIRAAVLGSDVTNIEIEETDMGGGYVFGSRAQADFSRCLEGAGQSWADVEARLVRAAAKKTGRA
jgi:hypothetical protein